MLLEGEDRRRVQFGVVALPVEFTGSQDREVGRGFRRPHRVPAREVVGDVIRVRVGPVEGEVDLRRRFLEAFRPCREPRFVELGETDR